MTIEELLYEVEQDLKEWLALPVPRNERRRSRHAVRGQAIALRLLHIMCVFLGKTAGGRDYS